MTEPAFTTHAPMPGFDPDLFLGLATRFFAELGAPWPSPLPPEQIIEQVFREGRPR